MKCEWALLALAAACPATTPPPFHFECTLVDRVAEVAKSGSPAQAAALEILERVAEARMDTAVPNLEVQGGLKPGQLRGPEFKERIVRAEALRKIAELDLPDALTFLRSLTGGDFTPHDGQLWPDAQIALSQALLRRIPDQPSQIKFLEAVSQTSVAYLWSVEELCNRGSYSSLPIIRATIRRHDHTRRGERRIAFCDARMDIVSRDPDRIKALGSFLSVRTLPDQGRFPSHPDLVGWAISQLQDMKSPRADAELQRFADEIEDLADGSERKQSLWGYRIEIRGMGPRRRQR